MSFRSLIILGAVSVAGSANAQLVFGHTYYSSTEPGFSGAVYLDVQTGQSKQLWTGAGSRKVNGLAADNTNQIMYANDAALLLRWSFGALGTQPTQINGLYRLGSNNTVYATGVDGLAFANSKLYAYTNYNAGGSAAFVEDGIYEVDVNNTTAATPNMTLKWMHSDLQYDLKGLEFNSGDGLFYATNTAAANAAGIYTIDVLGSQAITKIADFHPSLGTPDGLAIGGGYIWLTGKQTGDTTLKVVGYNLATHAYDQFFSVAGFSTTGRGTGATWAPQAVPEPGTLAALGLGALALLRRRRK
ncbi:MAG TPA: PEP-CTERM sorting domain-containing protein [Fimbriimonadaceae bacterium]|nr:PEP-CTERM sorting domain-containing protein [Fimbriimonadaceae bacterium]